MSLHYSEKCSKFLTLDQISLLHGHMRDKGTQLQLNSSSSESLPNFNLEIFSDFLPQSIQIISVEYFGGYGVPNLR